MGNILPRANSDSKHRAEVPREIKIKTKGSIFNDDTFLPSTLKAEEGYKEAAMVNVPVKIGDVDCLSGEMTAFAISFLAATLAVLTVSP